MDPLYKKAFADFDEGGAKGLLLNHLMIDGQGRIIFDSSDDANDVVKPRESEAAEMEGKDEEDEDAEREIAAQLEAAEPKEEGEEEQDVKVDVAALGARFFPDLSRLDELDVCPSLKTFELGDPSGSMDIPFLKAPEDWRQEDDSGRAEGQPGTFLDDENPLGFDDTDGLGAFDLGAAVNFGEGGEAWAKEVALEPQMRVFDAGLGDGGVGDEASMDMLDNVNSDYVVSMPHAQSAEKMHEDILSYFDQALQKNWTSAEHWRVRKIKDADKAVAPVRTRKEKEPFEIDFASPLDTSLAEMIYTQASSNSVISLPKKDWKAKSRNLLPDDKHFKSKQLLSLFLKPKARMSRRHSGRGRVGTAAFQGGQNDVPEGEMDEAFWASQKAPLQPDGASPGDGMAASRGDYDADFFADDGLPFAGGMGLGDDDDDMDEFADAREHFGPDSVDGRAATVDVGVTGAFGGLTVTNPADLAFGTMLVTQNRRVRPEYVQYARVAKKVDVRRLKEEIWKGMDFEKLESVGLSLSTFNFFIPLQIQRARD